MNQPLTRVRATDHGRRIRDGAGIIGLDMARWAFGARVVPGVVRTESRPGRFAGLAREQVRHVTLRNLCNDLRLSGRGWSLNVCGQLVHDTSPT